MSQGRILRAIGLSLFFLVSVSGYASAPAVPGEFIVKMRPSALAMSGPQLSEILGADVQEVVSQDLRLALVRRPTVESADYSLQALSRNHLIEYAEPNYIYRVSAGSKDLPNDPEFSRLWGLVNNGQITDGDAGKVKGVAGIDIGAKESWALETNAKNILIAVIDTGVLYNLPDIAPNIFTNEAELNGQSGVDDDGNGCVDDVHGCDLANQDGDPSDDFGHGTHVTGTIAAHGDNGLGIVGVAWNATVLPVKFLSKDGSGSLATAIQAIEYATRMKVNIMNNSWGGGGFSQAMLDAITKARDQGILFLAAAGNDGSNNDKTPTYPASYQVDNVMAVAAVGPDGRLASFSNYGAKTVQVAAPGVNILSYGLNGLEVMSGTSMACPHATGVAALLWAQDPAQSYATVMSRMIKSARPLGALRGRVKTAGLVNSYFGLTNSKPPVDLMDPSNWPIQKQNDVVETEHPYPDNARQTWTLRVPGAKRISVYFNRFETENRYDSLTLTDGAGQVIAKMSGNLGETYSPIIQGDTVTLTFQSDGGFSQYGFTVGGVAFQ